MKLLEELRNIVDWWKAWNESDEPDKMEDPFSIEILDEYLISQEIKYPRGIESWIKTFYDMAIEVHNKWDDAEQQVEFEFEPTDGERLLVDTFKTHGRGGIQELTERLTTEFETIHKDTDWHDGDHDFWIIIDEFVNNKLK